MSSCPCLRSIPVSISHKFSNETNRKNPCYCQHVQHIGQTAQKFGHGVQRKTMHKNFVHYEEKNWHMITGTEIWVHNH